MRAADLLGTGGPLRPRGRGAPRALACTPAARVSAGGNKGVELWRWNWSVNTSHDAARGSLVNAIPARCRAAQVGPKLAPGCGTERLPPKTAWQAPAPSDDDTEYWDETLSSQSAAAEASLVSETTCAWARDRTLMPPARPLQPRLVGGQVPTGFSNSPLFMVTSSLHSKWGRHPPSTLSHAGSCSFGTRSSSGP